MVTSPRSVTVLGATGSIGRATLDVLARAGDGVRVEALVAARNVAELAAAARRFHARLAVIGDASLYGDLAAALEGSGIEVAAGPAAVVEAASRPVDWTMAAIAGTAGLPATHAAISRGGVVALATKECIVSAGRVFLDTARRAGTTVLPVDSEHNAIFQSLMAGKSADVEVVTLTASGGPFRDWKAEDMARVRPEDALRHPTWSMGRKITIDSASLMNKGLELIEAMHLFGLHAEQLDVLVHPQSIVHGLVRYKDGSVIAGLAPADMRVAIAHCHAHPARMESGVAPLDLAAVGTLTFERPNPGKFPAYAAALDALKRGGGAHNILNAANDVAVEAFLAGRIPFPGIATVIRETLADMERAGDTQEPETLEDALSLHARAARLATDNLSKTIFDVV